MTDTDLPRTPVRNPGDIAHVARFVAVYGRGLLGVMAATAAGTLESGSPSSPTAEDTAYAILAALPALGWVRGDAEAAVAEAEAASLSGVAERLRLRAALQSIVNVLGPTDICSCEWDDESCAIRAEAAEALKVARESLRG